MNYTNKPSRLRSWALGLLGGCVLGAAGLALADGFQPVPPSGQSVTLSGVATVTVTGTPNVNVVNTPGVVISGTPTVAITPVAGVSSATDPGTIRAVTTASSTVIASNSARTGFCVIADQENFHNVYLKLGTGAATTNLRLQARDSYCEQGGGAVPVYSGAVAVITSYGGANVYTIER